MTEAAPDSSRAWLSGHGLRVTRPRLAVLQALHRHGEPLDAISLHRQIMPLLARVSLGTVYRTLRELEQRDAVQVQVAPHGRLHWQLRSRADTPTPASPAAASAQSPDAVQALAAQAARLGYRLVPLASPALRATPSSNTGFADVSA